MVRWLVTLACLLLAARASADGARVRWLGVASEGHAPAALDKAGVAHVAVALRQLGLVLVSVPPSSADASASCSFGATRVARCLVTVQSAAGVRAERHAQIPFHDADDLAESLALIVSDLLTTQFPEVLSPPPPEPPSATQPIAPPPPPSPPQQQPKAQPKTKRELEAERQKLEAAERARAEDLQQQANYEARARGDRTPATAGYPRAGLTPSRLTLELALTGVFTVGAANPIVGGALVRLMWGGGPLRAGASLSLGGSSQSAAGYQLGWFRGVLAARVGVGVSRHKVDFDATGGPALLVAYADAHAAGNHAFGSFAFVVGPHLGIDVARHVSLTLGADLQAALTAEKVVAGSTRVAQLSNLGFEVALGLAWRR